MDILYLLKSNKFLVNPKTQLKNMFNLKKTFLSVWI